MKSIIKKIGISIFTMILVSGIFIAGKSQNVLADGEDFTVIFHYTRSDVNYSNYTIKAYSVSDSQGKSGEFTADGSEGVFTYSFARNAEVDDQVRILIRSVDSDTVEIDSTVDISGATDNIVDVAIDGDNKTVGISDNSSAEPETQPATDNNTADVTGTSGEAATTIKSDDPNADYSVGTAKVIIIDIVVLVIIAVACFVVFSKGKKKMI